MSFGDTRGAGPMPDVRISDDVDLTIEGLRSKKAKLE